MPITMPDYLHGRNCTISSTQGICLASYRIEKSELRTEIFVSVSMLVFVMKGVKTITSAETILTVNPGEFCFIPKGNYIISSRTPPESGSFSAVLIFLEDPFIRDFIASRGNLFSREDPVRCSTIFSRKAGTLLEAAVRSLIPYFQETVSLGESIIRCKADEILLNIIADDSGSDFRNLLQSAHGRYGDDLEYYMTRNFHLPFTLDQFAKNTFRSLSRFKKEFSERFGHTPKKWINERRLEKAHMLLSSSDSSVTEICFLCGFDSLSYFIKLFREKYGITPKQYKNRF